MDPRLDLYEQLSILGEAQAVPLLAVKTLGVEKIAWKYQEAHTGQVIGWQLLGDNLLMQTLPMQHLYKAFFCGWGLGEDTESTIDGVNGNGFVDQSNGPFVVKFHDDGVKPDETGEEITDDIGFVIDYDLQINIL